MTSSTLESVCLHSRVRHRDVAFRVGFVPSLGPLGVRLVGILPRVLRRGFRFTLGGVGRIINIITSRVCLGSSSSPAAASSPPAPTAPSCPGLGRLVLLGRL